LARLRQGQLHEGFVTGRHARIVPVTVRAEALTREALRACVGPVRFMRRVRLKPQV
jgi:hypothetical protein